MASDAKFVEFICDQMAGAGEIRSRQMFGEWAIYCDEKMAVLICDNRVFLKPTPLGRELLGSPVEACPYPGAKGWFVIEEGLDDAVGLAKLVSATASQLEKPKPKAAKKKKA